MKSRVNKHFPSLLHCWPYFTMDTVCILFPKFELKQNYKDTKKIPKNLWFELYVIEIIERLFFRKFAAFLSIYENRIILEGKPWTDHVTYLNIVLKTTVIFEISSLFICNHDRQVSTYVYYKSDKNMAENYFPLYIKWKYFVILFCYHSPLYFPKFMIHDSRWKVGFNFVRWQQLCRKHNCWRDQKISWLADN